ncbi:MAG TPA: hypothetical protein VIR79_03900 [Nitrospira sp.]
MTVSVEILQSQVQQRGGGALVRQGAGHRVTAGGATGSGEREHTAPSQVVGTQPSF